MQRAPHFALGERGVGRLGPSSRSRDIHHNDSIDARIMLLDARQIEVEQFLRPDLLRSDQRRKLRGRTKSQAFHHAHPASWTAGARFSPSLPPQEVLPSIGKRSLRFLKL